MSSQEKPRSGLYYVIPASIMDSEALEPADKLLYALLSGYSDHEGKCFPSDKHLGERLHEPERTIKYRLKKLEGLDLISRLTTSCKSNPFKKIRIITVKTELKKSLRRATHCPLDSATHCPSEVQPIALIVSEANLVSEDPLLPSPNKPEPPTKEEEEELNKRLRERPPGAPRIVSKKKWMETVLKEIRDEEKAKKQAFDRFERHRLQMASHDMTVLNKMNVCCLKDRVELTQGSFCREVRYDVSDEEWEEKTGLNCNAVIIVMKGLKNEN